MRSKGRPHRGRVANSVTHQNSQAEDCQKNCRHQDLLPPHSDCPRARAPPLDVDEKVTALMSLCESPTLRVIPRSPPFLLADDEESRIALKTLRARFLSRDCGIGMTGYAGFSHRLLTTPAKPLVHSVMDSRSSAFAEDKLLGNDPDFRLRSRRAGDPLAHGHLPCSIGSRGFPARTQAVYQRLLTNEAPAASCFSATGPASL